MIRVFIADDHAVVRHGMRLLISETPDMQVVGEAADGREVLVAAEREEWDVLLLDLSLPRVSGTEVVRRLHEKRPSLAIVVLSMYPEDQYAVRLMREGALAYISKNRPSDELLAAIRNAARGGRYITQTVAAQMLEAPRRSEKLAHEALTAREYQIFILVANGGTVTEIAAELNLTLGTVSTHLHKVKEKLGARSVADIVGYAHRMGLVG